MGQSGRTCRRVDDGKLDALDVEPFVVKQTRDRVTIELCGRVIRTLDGVDALPFRDALAAGDHDTLQRLAAEKTRHVRGSR